MEWRKQTKSQLYYTTLLKKHGLIQTLTPKYDFVHVFNSNEFSAGSSGNAMEAGVIAQFRGMQFWI